MAYIVGLGVLGLLFLSLHYFTELSKTEKATVVILLFLIIFGAILYNKQSDTQRDKMLSVATKFRQGKNVVCDNQDVNSSNFALSIGTYTFIGKQDAPYFNQMISASQCE